MLTKRIIPCLDVKDGKVVKGLRFQNLEIIGEIEEYAQFYRDAGADELVFYDVTASFEQRVVSLDWVNKIAQILDIPFCVAGGIRSVSDARKILAAGADKISINTPALENPNLIRECAEEFGSQCVVVGIDSLENNGRYEVSRSSGLNTIDWAKQAQSLGAGEIVLNCINQDGVKKGYDIQQLTLLRNAITIPLIASGGAGTLEHFSEVFKKANVDGALAASVFHRREIEILELKKYLKTKQIQVRL